MLETMLNVMQQKDVDLVQCSYGCITLDNANNEKIESTRQTKNLFLNIDDDRNLIAMDGINPAVWNKLFKLDIIKNNNIKFLSKVTMGEDAIFLFNYLCCSKKTFLLADVLYFYNITSSHTNNVSLKKIKKYNEDLYKLCSNFYLLYNQNQLINVVNFSSKSISYILYLSLNLNKEDFKCYVNNLLLNFVVDNHVFLKVLFPDYKKLLKRKN